MQPRGNCTSSSPAGVCFLVAILYGRIASHRIHVWPGRVVAGALDLRLKRSRVRISAVPLSGNNLGQVIHTHTHTHTRASVAKQYNLIPVRAVMSCGWEGNRRSGVALATHHRLQWFIHLLGRGLGKGNEHRLHPSFGMAFLFLYRIHAVHRCGLLLQM